MPRGMLFSRIVAVTVVSVAAVTQQGDVAFSQLMRREPPSSDLKTVFDGIANSDSWGSHESISGPGSEIDMTASARECLGRWIQKYNIKVFVDAPCGDANWQGSIPDIDNIVYKGYDIADLPLQHARSKNFKHTGMSFNQLDLTKESPTDKPDLIMVRDVIQHLPLSKGRQMLLHAKATGAKYIAVTTFTAGKNIEIPAGNFYRNDVHAHPFSMPTAVEQCQPELMPTAVDYYATHPSDRLELIDLSTWNPAEL